MAHEETGDGPRLAELIAALSLAIDLGSGMSIETMLRSCVLTVRLGDALGLPEDELTQAYYLALLRFIGCTADAHTAASVFGDELRARGWFAPIDFTRPGPVIATVMRKVGEGEPALRRARLVAGAMAALPRMFGSVAAHCEVAERLAERLSLGPAIQRGLGQVYERWDGRGMPHGLRGEQVARPVRVALLAQEVVIHHGLGGLDAAVAMARGRAGGAHDPAIVDRFCRQAAGLLANIEDGSAWEAALAVEPGARPILSEPRLDAAVRAMADFADLKSPYLAGHSSGVGELAGAAAIHCRLPEAEVVAVRRAGYLHDIGRAGVSAALWAKPGPLTEAEWERVRLHAYYTERVLARPRPFARLAALAGSHHERLDGGGYHRALPATMLAPAARILAAADAYHAMTEPRPHRPALVSEAAADELRRDARAGRLCPDAVTAVLAAAGHAVRASRRAWPAGLSEREVEVLRLLTRGHSNREMARVLTISQKTVGHHIQHIYDKIGVSTRAGATLFAMQHDLLRYAPSDE